jgi:beta-lactamase regulating signal transducer with metallopeptidase domain
MTLLWMSYSVAAGLVLALAALAAERFAPRLAIPRRAVWAASLLVAMAASAVAWNAVPLPGPALLASSSVRMSRTLAALWILTCAAVGAVLLLSAENLRLRRKRWTPARVDDVAVLVTDGLGPAVVGLFRPAIAVPRWVLRAPDHQRRSVLFREAEHLEAGDHTLSAFALLAVALMPWNLPLWFHLHRLRIAIARDCDARVLDHLFEMEPIGEPAIEPERARPAANRSSMTYASESYLGWSPELTPQTPRRAD